MIKLREIEAIPTEAGVQFVALLEYKDALWSETYMCMGPDAEGISSYEIYGGGWDEWRPCEPEVLPGSENLSGARYYVLGNKE